MMDKIVYDRLDDLLSAIEYNGGGYKYPFER